ncbi:MAG: metallophosphoesterase [Acidobacteria bacterium]|nr:metallophosphoesterase [Acidobacteriota bacterium]
MPLSRRTFLAAAVPAATAPRFSFGLVADLQYADQDPAGQRDYRRSIEKLRAAREGFARERLAFVAQLGDLVDGGLANLDRMLPEWNRLAPPRYHVLGNHDIAIDRPTLLARLKLKRAYYSFTVRNWQFVVLDGTDPTVPAQTTLAGLRARKEPNAQTWNGGLGQAQMTWLRRELDAARRQGRRAILFCHFPVLPESCRPEHLLWNWREVLALLDSSPAAAAWFNGHDHRGGYAVRAGLHHVTLAGVVEHEVRDSARVVDVFARRLVLRREGESDGRELRLQDR